MADNKAGYRSLGDWDSMYAQGRWDYLDDLGEAPRYALVAGYVHRRGGEINLLDVGCGSGILLKYLDQSRVRYCGIDLSPTAVEQAKNRFPNADFRTCRIEDYWSATSCFDVIVFNEVLPHVEDPLGSLARYSSYLTARGIMVISTYRNVQHSNEDLFASLLEDALKTEQFVAVTGCELATFEEGRRWRIDVVGACSDIEAPF